MERRAAVGGRETACLEERQRARDGTYREPVAATSSSIDALRWSRDPSTSPSASESAPTDGRPSSQPRAEPLQEARRGGDDRRVVVGDEPVAAARRDGVDRTRDRVQLTADVERDGGGEERAAAIRRLDHDDRLRQAGDEPVAPREVRAARSVGPVPAR